MSRFYAQTSEHNQEILDFLMGFGKVYIEIKLKVEYGARTWNEKNTKGT